MQLDLTNVGKIGKASIRFDGLTLIAGRNDTGKSTVGKTIYTLVKAIHGYEKHSILRGKLHISKEILNHLDYIDRFIDKEIVEFINLKSEMQLLTELFESIQRDMVNERNKIMETWEQLPLSDFKKMATKVIEFGRKQTIYNTDEVFKKDLDEFKNSLEEESIEKKLSNKLDSEFRRTLDGNINNSLHYDDVAEINLSINRGEVLNCKAEHDEISINSFDKDKSIFSDATFVETPLILDCEPMNWSSYSVDLKKKIGELGNTDKKEIPECLNNNFNGRVFYKSNEGLKYKISREANELEISNMASGSKSFALLQILYRTGLLLGNPNHLLILDEPENHLHPEWQVQFAEILVKLIKEERLNVLITSHSPYLIKGLYYYAKKEGLDEKKVNFYLSEQSEQKENNYANIEKVELDELYKIFAQLSKPLKNMIWDEIED